MSSFLNFFRKKRMHNRAVLILGNGRSGTSVLTRCLNFMGVDLGNDKMLGPNKKINPKGYFENETIIHLHKQLGAVLRFRPSPEGYENSPQVVPIKNKIKDYVYEQFKDKEVWAWKDPRTNDYLALWKDILADLRVEPNCVIVVRNPIDVVASNVRAWNRDETWALRQWQLRTLFSIRDTYGLKRMIVSYEELFNHTLECLRKISTTLDLPWPEDEAELKCKIESFIDPKLQTSNSNTSLEDFINHGDVTQDVKDLYLLALEGTKSQEVFQSKAYHERVEKLYQDYLNDYGVLHRDPPKPEKNNCQNSLFNVKIEYKH